MLIDGKLSDASGGATYDNINPATESVIGPVADADESDMDRAIAAARRAFDETTWSADKAFRKAIRRTASRGVKFVVIVPGSHTDQRWVRLASRRMYGQLLETGVRIFEYEAGMTHLKALLVDELWAVVGTTNFDNRSFEHNDEVNVAFRDAAVTARIAADLEHDLTQCREITADIWRGRPLWEKLIGTVAWILERQQ